MAKRQPKSLWFRQPGQTQRTIPFHHSLGDDGINPLRLLLGALPSAFVAALFLCFIGA